MKNKNEIRRTTDPQKGVLFAYLYLLDTNGHFYYDNDTDIKEVENHLIKIDCPYILGYGTFRKKLSI